MLVLVRAMDYDAGANADIIYTVADDKSLEYCQVIKRPTIYSKLLNKLFYQTVDLSYSYKGVP